MNLLIKFGADFSLIIRIIAFIILLWQVIPLQIKEAKVKNGLRKMRILLLIMDYSILLQNIQAMILICLTKGTTNEISIFFQVVGALLTLVLAIVLYLIYHDQYTLESKEIHRRIDKLKEKNTIK